MSCGSWPGSLLPCEPRYRATRAPLTARTPWDVVESLITKLELPLDLADVTSEYSLLYPHRRRSAFLSELDARHRGARIRSAREIIGVHLHTVGEHIGVGKYAVHTWETGRTPLPDKATPVLRALDAHARNIVGDRAFEGFSAHVARAMPPLATSTDVRR